MCKYASHLVRTKKVRGIILRRPLRQRAPAMNKWVHGRAGEAATMLTADALHFLALDSTGAGT